MKLQVTICHSRLALIHEIYQRQFFPQQLQQNKVEALGVPEAYSFVSTQADDNILSLHRLCTLLVEIGQEKEGPLIVEWRESLVSWTRLFRMRTMAISKCGETIYPMHCIWWTVQNSGPTF
jgi:hypothetical protein